MSDFQTPTFHPQKYMVAAMTRQHNFFLFSFEFDIPITKAELPQVGIFFRNQFPSLGIFIHKRFGFQKN